MIMETSLNQNYGKKHCLYNGAFLKSLSIVELAQEIVDFSYIHVK